MRRSAAIPLRGLLVLQRGLRAICARAVAKFQSPCGDLWCCNARARIPTGAARTAFQSPCGDLLVLQPSRGRRLPLSASWSFNPLAGIYGAATHVLQCWSTARKRSFNPLAGIYGAATAHARCSTTDFIEFQSPCGDFWCCNATATIGRRVDS